MLESLESETPNIKDLSVELTPIKIPKFDVVNEISPLFRQKAFNTLQEWVNRSNMPVGEFTTTALYFKILFPEDFKRLYIGKGGWENMHSNLWKLNDPGYKSSYENFIAEIKIIFPDSIERFGLSNEIKNYQPPHFLPDESAGDEALYLKLVGIDLETALLLSPETIGEDIFSKQQWDKIKNYCLNNIMKLEWAGLPIKLISPAIANEIVSKLSRLDIKDLLSSVRKEFRLDNLKGRLRMDVSLKALFSNKVTVTPEGLQFLQFNDGEDKPVESMIPPLPEQRSF